eukprot:IDg3041t1
MKSLFTILLLLLVLALLAAPANGYETPSKCAALYTKSPELYNICETEICLVFRVEKPYIFVDGLKTLDDQAPFRCHDHKKVDIGVHGVIFNMINEMPELSNARCVWAGPECVFDDLIWFVGNVSKAGQHKFVAAGMLFLLRYRVSKYRIPSAALLEDQIVVVGPRQLQIGPSGAWRSIWRPFSTDAWSMLIAIVIVLLFVRVWTVLYYTDPLTFDSFGANLFGDEPFASAPGIPVCNENIQHCALGLDCHDCRLQKLKAAEREKGLTNMRILNGNWTKATRLFSVIDTTEEHVMHSLMVHSGKITPGEMPWSRAKNIDEVYRAMGAGPKAKFTLSYDKTVRHVFRSEPNACQRFEVYQTVRTLPSFSGVWYYGSKVALPERIRIDSAIAGMREQGRVRSLLENFIGNSSPSRCNPRLQIGALVIAFPLLIFLSPFVMRQIYLVVSLWCKGRDRSE